jgi:hypothetical protein
MAVQGAARETRRSSPDFAHPRLRLLPTLPEPDPPALVPVPVAEIVETTHWDPEPISEVNLIRVPVERTPYKRRSAYETELLLQEINGCKTLLLELIRRAAYDWILYRSSSRLLQKQLAEQAHEWLFLEMPGHPSWSVRERDGRTHTSFFAVCESLDLDPETARSHIRRLTPKHVMSVGRPAEYRRRDVFSAGTGEEDVHALPDGLVDYESIEGHDDGSDIY